MLDALLLPHTAPFLTAIFVCFFMLALSLFGLGGDDGLEADGGLDIDGGLDTDIDLPGSDGLSPEVQAELDAALEAADGGDSPETASGSGGALASVMSVLNPGGVPLSVLIALFAMGYGATGLLAQTVLNSLLGAPLPAWIAGLALLPAGVAATRVFGGLLGRAIPSIQSSAVKSTGLKGAPARITVGTAEIARPARARIDARRVDGQIVNVDVVPYRDGDSFPEGTPIVLLERTKKGTWIAGRLPEA